MAEAVTSVVWAISEEEVTSAGWQAGATEDMEGTGDTEDMADSADTEASAGTECRTTAVSDMVGHS